ncbi:MAG: excinuclease ABC subunit A, partial [Gemmataceae bacterium]
MARMNAPEGRESSDMENQQITIRGAREHNLVGVDLELPRNQLICFTGVSGSGKSSLAFDTLYAEGQRRYVESLSSYARQFMGQMQKPDVDFVGGLSPSISIQQKSASRNPRSTVGTITEIHDFFRVLYARVGQGHCPECGKAISAQTLDQIQLQVNSSYSGSRMLILAPVIRGQKGEYKDLFADMLRRGFIRARVDGEVVRLTDDLKLDRRIKHTIEIVIDRLKVDGSSPARLMEALEQASDLGKGNLILSIEKDGDKFEDIPFSVFYSCSKCRKSYDPPTPQLFSFNNPHGMCRECDGLGTLYSFDPALLIPDEGKSFYLGAIPLIGPLKGMGRWRKHIYEGIGRTFGMDLKLPWKKMPEDHRQILLYGSGDRHITYEWKQRGGSVWKHGGKWQGIIPDLVGQFKKITGGPRRNQLAKYMRVLRCPSCDGQRLNSFARSVRVGGLT